MMKIDCSTNCHGETGQGWGWGLCGVWDRTQEQLLSTYRHGETGVGGGDFLEFGVRNKNQEINC